MSAPNGEADGFFYVLRDALRILLVDDDPILREFAIVHLSSESAQVETAADGVEALEMLARARPDIILLDLEMPNMDGFEMLQRMQADPQTADIPVIVVTGREDVGAIDRAFEAGATSFVVKPINWRLLSYQIRFVRRAWKTQHHLTRAHREARTGSQLVGDALTDIARESARFLQAVVGEAPQLRQAAGGYAETLERLSSAVLAAANG